MHPDLTEPRVPPGAAGPLAGTVTFLLGDLAGSTRARQTPSAVARCARAHGRTTPGITDIGDVEESAIWRMSLQRSSRTLALLISGHTHGDKAGLTERRER